MVKVRKDLWNGNRRPMLVLTEKEKSEIRKARTVTVSPAPKPESIRYWMVDVTLTSGEVQAFYVKAKTKFDAMNKAEGLVHLALIPKLQTDKLLLRE